MASENNPGGMRPELGDSSMTLPITFDYSGGRRESGKSRKIWAAIFGVVGLLLSIGVLLSKEQPIYIKLPISVAIAVVVSLIIRFIFLGEKKIRASYMKMQETDYKRDYGDIWGIYSIDQYYPHFCRFRNGKSGMFISLQKDIIVGRYSDNEYNHYEAIADAYNLAGAGRVQMIHIDYMDNVGTDERLENSFVSLEDVSNPDLKDLLVGIFTFQQDQMMKQVTTFDTYLFMWSGSDTAAWNTIQRILACFLDANYRSYKILNENALRDFAKTLFNLSEFSVMEASASAFDNSTVSGIVPIKVVDEFGVETILGKTSEQKREEQRLREEERIAKDEELKRRKKSKKNKTDEDEGEELDIFGE